MIREWFCLKCSKWVRGHNCPDCHNCSGCVRCPPAVFRTANV